MSIFDDIRAGNERYSVRFDGSALKRPPVRRLAVVTCMDARYDPVAVLGLHTGDVGVIRNAGGIVTDDVLRSLAIAHHLLRTEHVLVIGHTDCGQTAYTNEFLRNHVGPGAEDVDFLPFPDVATSVRWSVGAIEASPLLPASYTAHGYIYDVVTGKLDPV